MTLFELQLAAGTKVNKVTNLSKDLARALSVVSVRVVEVIPGKTVIGLEIPNEARELVTLGEILRSKAYDDMRSPLAEPGAAAPPPAMRCEGRAAGGDRASPTASSRRRRP